MVVYYLETSALLKRYRTELGSEVITELIEQKRPDEFFVTSYFTALEIEVTIARALKARLINQRAYKAILGRFAEDLVETVVLQPVTNHTIREATDLTRRNALRGADAVHLATALIVKQLVPSSVAMVMVTSDTELLVSAEREQSQVLDPQHSAALQVLATHMAAYLEAALEDGDGRLVAAALGDIARAKGMA